MLLIPEMSGFKVRVQFFGSGEAVVGSIHGSRRTHFIVVSPTVPSRYFYPAGKVHRVVVAGGVQSVRVGLLFEEIVRPSAGLTVEKRFVVAKGGMDGGEAGDIFMIKIV